ncbi:MAG: sulfotransferase [Phycisphaerales bacterium]|nr:sulfotransferase [Phycisphaerales bacterium]
METHAEQTEPSQDRAAQTPSHTARIAELDRLFGGNVKFVHLVREPTETIDSNVRLHLSLDGHLLEDAPDVQTIRDRVVEEYAHTESKAASELHSLNDDERTNSKRYIRVRYQDLRADEMGTLQEIYNTLGIPNLWWNSECESSARSYLQSLGTYTTNRKLLDLGTPSEREQEVCEEMREYHCHDVPPANESNIDPVEQAPSRIWRGIASGTLIAIACALAWIGIVWALHAINPNIHARFVPAVWICGALIGMGAHKAAGTGSRRVGLVAAALTILVVLGVAFPVTVINWNWAADGTRSEWIYHNAKGGYEGLRSVASVVFIILGALTAYRHGSSAGPKAPGNESLTL